MQTRMQSLIETAINIGIGVIGSLAITLTVNHTVNDRNLASVLTVALCTIWSIGRGYAIRRHFNGKVPK